jgi:hypothetical protein
LGDEVSTMRHTLCLFVVITLIGCVTLPGDNTVTVADGVVELAPDACERMYRCDHARFGEVFSDVGACIDHIRSAATDQRTVDAAQVDECGEWLATAACDATPTPCAWTYH